MDKWAKTPKDEFLNFLLGTKDYDFFTHLWCSCFFFKNLILLMMLLFLLLVDLAQMMFSFFLLVYHAYDVFFPLPINPSWHPTSLPLWFLLLIRRLQCAIIWFATCILTLAHCLAFVELLSWFWGPPLYPHWCAYKPTWKL